MIVLVVDGQELPLRENGGSAEFWTRHAQQLMAKGGAEWLYPATPRPVLINWRAVRTFEIREVEPDNDAMGIVPFDLPIPPTAGRGGLG
jgi:hypothetical protein